MLVFVIFTELFANSTPTSPVRTARNGQPLSIGQGRKRQ